MIVFKTDDQNDKTVYVSVDTNDGDANIYITKQGERKLVAFISKFSGQLELAGFDQEEADFYGLSYKDDHIAVTT